MNNKHDKWLFYVGLRTGLSITLTAISLNVLFLFLSFFKLLFHFSTYIEIFQCMGEYLVWVNCKGIGGWE